MTYYLWMNQSGEGCDYTIGCAKNLIALPEDTTSDNLKEKVMEVFEHYGVSPTNVMLDDARIMTEHQSVMSWFEEYIDNQKKTATELAHKKKEEEYARLGRELGK
jgi:hypothetical protein